MKPTLSIIIVLYNSADELPECLDSVAADVDSGWAELILVDNASPDASVEVAIDAMPRARLISLSQNVGFAGGVNAALPYARGEYTLLLNPDIEVPAEGLREMVAWMDEHPRVGASSPDLSGSDGSREPPARALPSVWRPLLEMSRTHKLLSSERRSSALLGAYWTGHDETNVGWVPGTAMFVRREVMDQVGPLNASFFMYGEDIEWCWRMRRAGYRIGVCTSTRFVHHTSASSRRTWSDDESTRMVMSGIHQATETMYGTVQARAVAASTALGLTVESVMPGRDRESALRSGRAARLWWALAARRQIGERPTTLPNQVRLHQPETPMADQPLVSVCITTRNGVAYAQAAVESALAQTYQPLEVVIVDDASDDGTFEMLCEIEDPRIRLHRNETRLGQSANRNRALKLSRGELIKFLDQDDLLLPECVESMARLACGDDTIGLVFCRRQIIDEHGRPDIGSEWTKLYGTLHTEFGELAEINDGRELLRTWLRVGIHRNLVGEPSAVLVSRSHVCSSGGFSESVPSRVDIDLWLRMFSHARVGFIDKELVAYRHGHVSETVENGRSGRRWLDRLWTLELLNDDEEVRRAYPEIVPMLRRARREGWRTVAKLGLGADGSRYPVVPYLDVLRFRAERLIGRRL